MDAGGAAAELHAVLFAGAHEFDGVRLGYGDGLVNEHGDARLDVGLGIAVVIVAVAGGDDDAVHFTDEFVVLLGSIDTELFRQLGCSLGVIAVNADEFDIVHQLLVDDEIEERVGMRILAAEDGYFKHGVTSIKTAWAWDLPHARSR